MLTNWERRIKHIDRKVKPTVLRGLRGQLTKARVKERRGLPSRNLPAELVLERVATEFGGRTDGDDVAGRLE